jgi:6-phosphogluconolactonase
LWRVTLTAPFINRAALVLFIVSGAAKAEAVKAVIEGGTVLGPEGTADFRRLPARLINPAGGRLCWLLDAAAASGLEARGQGVG